MCTLCDPTIPHYFRGKTSFDQAGVGASKPADVEKSDDEFELYRKRMMLAYRFRPNPLVRYIHDDIHMYILYIHVQ